MLLLMMLLTTASAWADGYNYIDADGTVKNTATDGIDENDSPVVINSSKMPTTLSGWYVVTENVTYTTNITLDGNTTIILADGCTMSIGEDSDGNRINAVGIYGSGSTLTIYGQSLAEATAGHLKVFTTNYWAIFAPYTQHSGNVTVKSTAAKAILPSPGNFTVNGGTLNVTSIGEAAICADTSGNIFINGGKVNATSSTDYAFLSCYGNITITGGQVEANGGLCVLAENTTITLGLTSDTDYIKASDYYGTVNIASGKTLYDGSDIAYSSNNVSIPDNVTLRKTNFPQTATNEYTILTSGGWGLFCDALEDNDTYDRFSGKTVKLDTNITVSRMAGSSKHDFCGTFDGQGHTLTVNISSDSRDYTAPFSYVSTVSSIPAVIRNLNVAGTVTATKDYAGGIVGAFWGTLTIENCTSSVTINTDNKHAAGFISRAQGNATIRNCLSSVTINSSISGDGTHAGFVGGSASGVETTITGCAFTGSLIGTNTTHCAGFVGYNSGTLTITNSLFAPASVNVVATSSATFARYGNNCVTNIDNCYYTQTLGTAQGKQARSIKASYNVKTNGNFISAEGVTVAHAGEPTTYSVSGIKAYKASDAHGDSDPFTAGIVYNDVLYAGSGDEVSLTLGNTPPTGYEFDSYTTEPDGVTISGDANPYTLTMPNGDVWVRARFAPLPISVSYIDENGKEQTVDDAIDLSKFDGDEIPAGSMCSFSSDGISLDLILDGDVTIIIPDDFEITVDYIDGYHTVTFYGQEKGNGKLNVIDYVDGNVTVHGGNVSIGAEIDGNVTLHGGTVTLPSVIDGCVTIADGKRFYNGSEVLSSGTVDTYKVNGKTLVPAVAVTLADGITATSGIIESGNDKYAKVGETVTVSTSGATAPEGYTISITVSPTVTVTDNGNGTYSFTMPAEDATVSAAFLSDGQSHDITYMKADGTTDTHAAIALDETMTNLSAGWYFVGTDINYTQTVNIKRDATIILKDGCTMNVGTSSERISDNCISGLNKSLTIYGQTAQTGTLNAYNSATSATVGVKNYTQHGGTVTIDATSAIALYLSAGDLTLTRGSLTAKAANRDAILPDNGHTVTVSGGTLSATAGSYAIAGALTMSGGTFSATGGKGAIFYDATVSGGTLTATGLIRGNVTIAAGQVFTDGNGHYYAGTLTADEKTAINRQTLTRLIALQLADAADNTDAIAKCNGATGLDITLQGRTLYKDDAWNTLCLPFDLTIAGSTLDGADVRALDNADLTNDVLTLNFTREGAVSKIEAGKPYIIKWKEGENLVSPVFTGVTVKSGLTDFESSDGKVNFKGTYAPLSWTEETPSILFVGAKNTLNWPLDGAHLNAFRAYFELDPNAHAREFVMNFDGEETTGIISNTDRTDYTDKADAWYSLDGRKLNSQPTQKGMYIKNGQKVVVK